MHNMIKNIMEKERIIKLIEEADIKEDDWIYKILDTMTDKYAKGYLRATISGLNNSFSTTSKTYRKELLEVCNYNIWNN